MGADSRPGWRRLRGAKRRGGPREAASLSPTGVPVPALVSIFVGGNPVGVAITPDGSHAYITSEVSDAVSVIDTATATVSATIAVGSIPAEVAITPDGSHAYVTNFDAGTVVVIPTGAGRDDDQPQ